MFIPITTTRNPNQKGRNDQKYCNNLYQDTGKTCYGLHYNHSKKFKEAKFNEWSKKAQKLRDKYSNEQIEDFKMELKKLSDKYYIV